jgi:cell division protein FtsL
VSTIADARVVDSPRKRRARVPTLERRARRTFAGGVLWIVLLGILLAGIVGVNVAVLQLMVRVDRLGGERAELKADNARIRSRLSSASASMRIEQQARIRLGLEPADPLQTTYVRLDPEHR